MSGNYNVLGRKHYSSNTVKTSYLTLLPFLIVVVGYELLPLGQLVVNSLKDKATNAFSFSNYIKIFTTPLYQMSIINSVRISLISAAVAIVVAFFATQAYMETGKRCKKLFVMILNMTSNFSGVPLTFAFMILMGNTGVLTLIGKELSISWLENFNLYSGTGLVLLYIYFQIPLATFLLIPAFTGIKKEWREAALIMHANCFQYWIKIGIPNLLPSILGTISVLFANALAAYATAYALVLNNYALLALQISSKFKGDVKIDKQLGGALAVVLILLMIAATMGNNYLTKKNLKGKESI